MSVQTPDVSDSTFLELLLKKNKEAIDIQVIQNVLDLFTQETEQPITYKDLMEMIDKHGPNADGVADIIAIMQELYDNEDVVGELPEVDEEEESRMEQEMENDTDDTEEEKKEESEEPTQIFSDSFDSQYLSRFEQGQRSQSQSQTQIQSQFESQTQPLKKTTQPRLLRNSKRKLASKKMVEEEETVSVEVISQDDDTTMLEEEGAGILREPCGIFEYKKPKKTIIHIIEKANKKLDEYGDEMFLNQANHKLRSDISWEIETGLIMYIMYNEQKKRDYRLVVADLLQIIKKGYLRPLMTSIEEEKTTDPYINKVLNLLLEYAKGNKKAKTGVWYRVTREITLEDKVADEIDRMLRIKDGMYAKITIDKDVYIWYKGGYKSRYERYSIDEMERILRALNRGRITKITQEPTQKKPPAFFAYK